jgi:hypothetical protein
MKEPFASVCVVICITPFALRTCTVAPVTAAPDTSTTVPVSWVTPPAFAAAHDEAVEQTRMIRATVQMCSRPLERLDGISPSTYDHRIRVTERMSVYHVFVSRAIGDFPIPALWPEFKYGAGRKKNGPAANWPLAGRACYIQTFDDGILLDSKAQDQTCQT